MNFGIFSYVATILIFTGLAILLYLAMRLHFARRSAQLSKSDWKVILFTILIAIVVMSLGEWIALGWRIWAYNPEKTFHTTFLGAEVETYLFIVFVSLVISIATLVYARREDRKHNTANNL